MGEHGDQLRPLPHVPRLLCPDGIIKPPREGERSAWAAEDPCSGRGLGVAGPGLRRRPVARLHWQGFPCHVARGMACGQLAGRPRSSLRETGLSEDGAHKHNRPLRVGS